MQASPGPLLLLAASLHLGLLLDGAAWIILQLLHSSQSSQAAPVNSMVSFNVIKIACLMFAVSGNTASLRGYANAQSGERNLATFDSIINSEGGAVTGLGDSGMAGGETRTDAQSAERKLERCFLLPRSPNFSRNFRSQSEERNLATFDSIINLLLNHH